MTCTRFWISFALPDCFDGSAPGQGEGVIKINTHGLLSKKISVFFRGNILVWVELREVPWKKAKIFQLLFTQERKVFTSPALPMIHFYFEWLARAGSWGSKYPGKKWGGGTLPPPTPKVLKCRP